MASYSYIIAHRPAYTMPQYPMGCGAVRCGAVQRFARMFRLCANPMPHPWVALNTLIQISSTLQDVDHRPALHPRPSWTSYNGKQRVGPARFDMYRPPGAACACGWERESSTSSTSSFSCKRFWIKLSSITLSLSAVNRSSCALN